MIQELLWTTTNMCYEASAATNNIFFESNDHSYGQQVAPTKLLQLVGLVLESKNFETLEILLYLTANEASDNL